MKGPAMTLEYSDEGTALRWLCAHSEKVTVRLREPGYYECTVKWRGNGAEEGHGSSDPERSIFAMYEWGKANQT